MLELRVGDKYIPRAELQHPATTNQANANVVRGEVPETFPTGQ